MKNIFWFTHDLRVQDNPTLKLARERSDNQLTAVFLLDPISAQQMGDPRKRFLCQALAKLGPHVIEVDANTLFSEQQLPFAIDDLPTTFSRARNKACRSAAVASLTSTNFKLWLDMARVNEKLTIQR